MGQDTDQPDAGTTSGGVLGRVVSWLRAGYPDGVPQQDYIALLGVLRRNLTGNEVEQVVQGLTDDAASSDTLLTRQVIEQRIADVMKGPVLDSDVVRVSARLAAAGWPLAALDREADSAPAPRANLITRIVGWLRSGYPEGLPERDYIPLVALLRRRLTDNEVMSVSRELISEGILSPDRVDIGTAISRVTENLPSDEDTERVRRYLTDHDWPSELGL